jgi:hypothetical protein
MQRAGVLLLCLGLAGPLPASAEIGLGAGPVEEIRGKRSWAGVLAYRTPHRHPWELALGHLERRRIAGFRNTPDVNFLAVSKQVALGPCFLSAGLAYTDEDNDVLSGHAQFYLGAGLRRGRWGLSLRHLSNGQTKGRNLGETFLVIEWRR